jgi:pilus assembly protein CpaF
VLKVKMALLKRLGVDAPEKSSEDNALGRRLRQTGAESSESASSPEEPEPVSPQKQATPKKEDTTVTESSSDRGLLGRISQVTELAGETVMGGFGRQEERPPPDPFMTLKFRVQDLVIAELGPQLSEINTAQVRRTVEQKLAQVLAEEGLLLGRLERENLLRELEAEVWGYGPLQKLLDDPTVNEIMVNGPDHVYVEREGQLELSGVRFFDEDHMLRVISRALTPVGRRVDENAPMADARLPDGSRMNVIIPPLVLNGPTITVRKFSHESFEVEDLIRLETITPEVGLFLAACVWARLNIVVSGGASSGKTTLLNILSSFIPRDERIVTVETTAELSLGQDHVVPLEARPPNVEGKGEVTVRQLVINCLRMRPERIVVGECRGGEAIDMLQAMNTGHDGSLTTTHANSPLDVVSRLEVMCMMAGMNLPSKAIREQIASAVQLIVHMTRMRDGTRKVTQVTEIQGMEGDQILLQDIYVYEQQGLRDGKVVGRLRPTGFVPRSLDILAAMNVHVPQSLFESQGLGQMSAESFGGLLARFGRAEEEVRSYKVDWLKGLRRQF